jgi:protein O-GlcNAc transferase
LAILLATTGQPVEADLAADRAALFAPNDPLVQANRALVKLQVDRISEGLAAARRAVELTAAAPAANDPTAVAGYLLARLAFAMLSATSGRPQDALPAYKEMLKVDPKHPAAGPNSCFITSLMDVGPDVLREVRATWHASNRHAAAVWPHNNRKDPDKPLKVGYVGGDFKSHSAAMMFANVLLRHDHAKVIPYFYCSLPTDAAADDLTQKFQFAAGRLTENPDDGPPLVVADGHRWRDIYSMPDEAVDDLIRKDGIDILVDLAGHTNGGRLTLFTRKPAPVQVTAWGFAHGTGCPEIDYFFEYGMKPSSPLPYFTNEYITFGTFSRFEKLSDECLATFAEVLKRVPNSRMFFKDHAMRRPDNIRRILEAFDGFSEIDSDRVQFGISTPHHEHMGAYARCDLYLDPFPHGSGIVALEVLYAGVPMVTLYGKQPAGRTASSVLTVLGRADWIARTKEEYVEKVVDLAGRPHDLAAVRKTLRADLVNSPVVKDYHAAVEEAYRRMWRVYCDKRGPL